MDLSVKQMLEAMRMLKDRLVFNESMTPAQLEELDDLMEEMKRARNDYVN